LPASRKRETLSLYTILWFLPERHKW